MTTCSHSSRASDNYADSRHAHQQQKPARWTRPQRAEQVVGIVPASAQFVYGLLGSDYDGSPYTQSGNLVAELAVRGIRMVIEEFRADVTKTLNYPDCLVMPTLPLMMVVVPVWRVVYGVCWSA